MGDALRDDDSSGCEVVSSTSEIEVRPMTAADVRSVSELGIQSKASWGYSSEMMDVFSRELTLDERSLDELLDAQVACRSGQVLGYFTIRRHPDDVTELEHLFVHPKHFRQGIGCQLLQIALTSAARTGAATLTVIADAHSVGFYERFGAIRAGEHRSSIPGRVIPVVEFSLDQSS